MQIGRFRSQLWRSARNVLLALHCVHRAHNSGHRAALTTLGEHLIWVASNPKLWPDRESLWNFAVPFEQASHGAPFHAAHSLWGSLLTDFR